MGRSPLLLHFVLAGALPLLWGCELGYLLQQGWHQARLLSHRRPVHEVLADPSVDSRIKEGIRLIQRVRAFGEDELGLKPSDAYSSFIEIRGEAVAYVVSAARRDRLEPLVWRFPLVGRFPYKGFFRLEDARKEGRLLEEKGYDVHLGGVAAYSALGWFSDPLYSPMALMDETHLVSTILHEMVHGTVFFRDRVDFNEQLATLVGWQGAVLYQEAAHGPDSPQARRAREALEDARREAAFLEDAHRRLQAFYDLPLSPEEKLAGRGAVFEEIRRDARSLAGALAAPGRSPLEDRPWNNASLLALWRYRYDTGGLEALHVRLGRDLRRLIAWVKEWQAQGWDPREMMAQGAPGP